MDFKFRVLHFYITIFLYEYFYCTAHWSGFLEYALYKNQYYYIITSRVPVEGKLSALVCDLYEIWDNNFYYYHYQLGSNIIIVYCKHITHTRTHARTHTQRRRHSGCLCSMSQWRPNVTELRPFSLVPQAINGRSLLHSKNTGAGDPVSPRFWLFFAYKKNARPN